MSPFNVANSKPSENENPDEIQDDGKEFQDVVSRHVFQGKPALRNWKIKTEPDANSLQQKYPHALW